MANAAMLGSRLEVQAAASLVDPSSGVGTSSYAYWGGFAARLLGGYVIAYWTWRR